MGETDLERSVPNLSRWFRARRNIGEWGRANHLSKNVGGLYKKRSG